MKTSVRTILASLILTASGALADVPLSNTWSFYNSEGSSQLNNQSATGFDFVCNPIVGGIVQATAAYVTTVGADTVTPSAGVLVTAPGHGIAIGSTATVYLSQTSVAAYNTRASATAHTATAVTANTLTIPSLTYTVDATGGTVGTGTATLASTITGLRPRDYQTFAPVNMSTIGAAFSVQLDFTLRSNVTADLNDVFRVCFGDTVKNAEIVGLFDLGATVGGRDDGIKIREDNKAFNLPPFNTSNPYAGAMGAAGQSWNVEGHFPQPGGEPVNRITTAGIVFRIYANLVRRSSTEISVLFRYEVLTGANAGDASELYALRYTETSGLTGDTGSTPGTGANSDAWGDPTGAGAPAGSMNQINFFGVMFESSTPFPSNGGINVSNVRVGTDNYFKTLYNPTIVTDSFVDGFGIVNTRSIVTMPGKHDFTSSGSRFTLTNVFNVEDFVTASPSYLLPAAPDSSGVLSFTDNYITAPQQFYRFEFAPRLVQD